MNKIFNLRNIVISVFVVSLMVAGGVLLSSPKEVKAQGTTSSVLNFNFESISGTTVYDASSFQNNGVLTNGASVVGNDTHNGAGNHALLLSGNNYLIVPHSPSLDVNSTGSGAITIDAWVNPSSCGADLNSGNIVSNGQYYLSTGGCTVNLYLAGSYAWLSSTQTIPLNQWSHVKATWDGSVEKIYINDAEVGSLNFTNMGSAYNNELDIGARTDNTPSDPWGFFSGLIDDVQIHNFIESPVSQLCGKTLGSDGTIAGYSGTGEISYSNGTYTLLKDLDCSAYTSSAALYLSSNTTLDGGNNTLIGSSSNWGIILSDENNVTVKNLKIAAIYGLYANAVDGLTLTGNTLNLLNSNWGFLISNTSGLTMNNNTVTGTADRAIYLAAPLNVLSFAGNTVKATNLNDIGYAITLVGLNDLTNFSNNTIQNGFFGLETASTNGLTITPGKFNFINNSYALYDMSDTNLTIDGIDFTGNANAITMANSSGTTTIKNTISKVHGIYITNANGTLDIENNDLSGSDGIYATTSSAQNFTAIGNNIHNNAYWGIKLEGPWTATVTHNNIYSSSGTNFIGDQAYAVDYNYWGHDACSSAFTAGTDSNRTDIIDNHPYTTLNGWAGETTPGALSCVPPVAPVSQLCGKTLGSDGTIAGYSGTGEISYSAGTYTLLKDLDCSSMPADSTALRMTAGATLDGAGFTLITGSSNYGIYTNDENNITVKNLKITGTGLYHAAILLYGGEQNLLIQNITLTGTSPTYGAANDGITSWYNSAGGVTGLIDNVTISGFSSGINLAGANNLEIKNSDISGNGMGIFLTAGNANIHDNLLKNNNYFSFASYYLGTESSPITVKNNDFSGSNYGIYLYPSTTDNKGYVTIDGNTGTGFTSTGIYIPGDPTYPTKNITITNNNFSGAASYGFSIGNVDGLILSGNNVSNSNDGFYITGQWQATITNNIANNDAAGFDLRNITSTTTFTNNDVTGSNWGLFLYNDDGLTIDGSGFTFGNNEQNITLMGAVTNTTFKDLNLVGRSNGTGNHGIYFYNNNGMSDITVDNVVFDKYAYGIYAAYGVDNFTIKNSTFKNSQWGVYTVGDNLTFTHNNIYNNGAAGFASDSAKTVNYNYWGHDQCSTAFTAGSVDTPRIDAAPIGTIDNHPYTTLNGWAGEATPGANACGTTTTGQTIVSNLYSQWAVTGIGDWREPGTSIIQTLAPGDYTFLTPPPQYNNFTFSIDTAGKIVNVDSNLTSGVNPAVVISPDGHTMIVNGYTETVISKLNSQWTMQNSVPDWRPIDSSVTGGMLPGNYTFMTPNPDYNNFSLTIDISGKFQFTDEIARFVDGRGTNIITVNGFYGKIISKINSEWTITNFANNWQPAETFVEGGIIPGNYTFMAPGPDYNRFSFTVDAYGNFQASADVAKFVDGLDSKIMTVNGFPIKVVSNMDGQWYVGNFVDNWQPEKTFVEGGLLPGGYNFMAPAPNYSNFAFTVDADGLIQGAPTTFTNANDNVTYPVTGKDRNTLTVGSSDQIAPTSKIDLTGTVGLNNWYISTVNYEVTATDNVDGSGVKDIYSCVDQSNTCTPTLGATGTVTSESTNYVRFYSTDNTGNKEDTKTQEVKIDTVPPTITLDNWQKIVTTGQITITGLINDDTSGPNTLTINGQTVNLNANTFSYLMNLIEGDNYVAFAATDTAGLSSTLNKKVTLIYPPVITVEPQDQAVYSGDNVTFNVTATGTEPLTYQWYENGLPVGTNTTSYTINNVQLSQNGYNYYVKVTNEVGQDVSRKTVLTVTVKDITPPVSTLTTTPTTPNGSNNWFTVTPSYTVTAIEDQSTLAHVYACTDQTNTCDPLTGLVGTTSVSGTITTEGINYVRYQAIDSMNNLEAVKSVTISYDKTNPNLTVNAIPAMVSDPNLTIKGNATDSQSGIGSLTINGTPIPPITAIDGAFEYTLALNEGLNTITVIATDNAGLTTTVTKTVTLAYPVVITSQSGDQTVFAGDSVTLSVTATGSLPLSYQWYENGQPTGTNSATLDLSNITTAQNGYAYKVVVSNIIGGVTSKDIKLTVTVKDTTAPVSTLTLTPAAPNGTDNWYTGNPSYVVTATEDQSGLKDIYSCADQTNTCTPFPGATGVISTEGTNYIRYYSTDNAGNIEVTKSATLKLDTSNPILSVSVPTTATDPSLTITGTLTDAISGVLSLTINNAIVPVTGGAFTYNTILTEGSNTLTFVGTDNAGNYTTITKTIVLTIPPEITVQPQSQTVLAGSNVTFTVAAIGTAPLKYQWYVNGAIINGATNTSLTLTNVTSALDGKIYTVTVKNTAGSDTSDPATLKVTTNKDTDGDGIPDVDDHCPTVKGKPGVYQGCPFVDQTIVTVQTQGEYHSGICGKDKYGKPIDGCKAPLQGILVKVYDRENTSFTKQYNVTPGSSKYAKIYEQTTGLVGSCTTDATGTCYVGEDHAGKYLVIAKYTDTATGRTVYTGKLKNFKCSKDLDDRGEKDDSDSNDVRVNCGGTPTGNQYCQTMITKNLYFVKAVKKAGWKDEDHDCREVMSLKPEYTNLDNFFNGMFKDMDRGYHFDDKSWR